MDVKEDQHRLYTGFDINRRLVAAASANGMSFSQVKRFFASLNTPQPMNEKTGYQLKKRVYGGARRAADTHLQAAAEQMRATYVDTNLG